MFAVLRAVFWILIIGGAVLARSNSLGRAQGRLEEDVSILLDKGLYDQAESVARAHVLALTAAYGAGSLEVAVASDLLVHALCLNGKASIPSTLALADETLRNKRAHLSATHPDLAPSLLNLGQVLSESAEHSRAIAALEQAVSLREGAGPPSDMGLAEALDMLGIGLVRAGRYDEALRMLDRALRIKESVNNSGRGVARTLEAMVSALQWKGDYSGARAPLQRALGMHREEGAVHPAYVEALNLLGLQLWFEGSLPEARDASASAVEAAEHTLRPGHPELARSLQNLSVAIADLGDIVKARSLQERALAIAEGNFGPNHHEVALYLGDLANSNLLLGAYPTARSLLERALKIREARLGPRHQRVATIVYNLAGVDAALGDFAEARRQLARAMAIWERELGRDHPFVAVALTEFAGVLREQGSVAQAQPLLERALAIRERSLGLEHRDVARTLADLSATLVQLGQGDRAQALATRALGIWERAGTPETQDLATILGLYAELQLNRGDAAVARQYYDRALAIKERVFGRSHPVFADTQARLARALMGLGENAPALKAATEAETTGREHLRVMLRYLPERQSLNYAANRPKGLDMVLSLIDVAPDAATAALEGLIRSRALVLDEMAARRRATGEAGESAALRVRLASAQQRLANLVVRGPRTQAPARYAALVENARRESELAERTLAENSISFRAELGRSQIGLDQVRNSLPTRSALVSFVRYERQRSNTAGRDARSEISGARVPRTVTSYLAFVLKENGPPIVVPLGGADVIDSLVTRWRADIAWEPLRAGQSRTVGRSARASGALLRGRVWDPLADHLRGVNRIFIVPDGTLSLVPFVALPTGQTAYLLEEAPVIHYLSTERDLVQQPGKSTNVGQGMLALGGPAFDDRTLFAPIANRGRTAAPLVTGVAATRSGCGDFQTLRFHHLEGTVQEVRELAGLWNTPTTAASEGVRVLVAREATERAFKQEAPRHRVLHLATHGFFLGRSCPSAAESLRSVGGLATNPASKAGNQSRLAAGENPLLLSGLALAGANRRASAGPDDEDGILTAEEVATLNLEGLEWAVLSACDTGVGEVKAGEGVFGLRRAFQIAGARTVVMSLWSVDDQAARAWMRALYEGRFQNHLATIDAVHEASLTVLRARRTKGLSTHPFYWAAFVAAGDWS